MQVDEKDKQLLNTKAVPNFLAPNPNMRDIYGIGDLSTPQVNIKAEPSSERQGWKAKTGRPNIHTIV